MYREIKLYNVCVSDIIASLNKVNVPTILLFLEYQLITKVIDMEIKFLSQYFSDFMSDLVLLFSLCRIKTREYLL